MTRYRRYVAPCVLVASLACGACILIAITGQDRAQCRQFEAATVRTIGVGKGPHFVAAADLNADGGMDLVTANCEGASLSVLLADGQGGFAPHSIHQPGSPTAVAAHHIDADPHLDLVATCFNSNTVSVRWGRGDGSFDATEIHTGGATEPHGVACADLDRDGFTDLAIANGRAETALVLYGDGSRGFPRRTVVPMGFGAFSILAEDLDGDGWPDLVTANAKANDLTVALADGAGAFEETVHYPLGSHPSILEAGDLDGDGVLDVVAAVSAKGEIVVLRGTGDGRLEPTFPAGHLGTCTSVEIEDFDGDGLLDLFAVVGGGVSLLRGQGDLTFQRIGSNPVGEAPTHSVFADLDGDGAGELIVANYGSNDISVLSWCR